MTKEEEKISVLADFPFQTWFVFCTEVFERYKSIDKARSLSETDIKKQSG